MERLLLADQHAVPDSLLAQGLGRWIKNRFQNCLKSAGKPAARWRVFLPQGVNYFEYGKGYFGVSVEAQSCLPTGEHSHSREGPPRLGEV